MERWPATFTQPPRPLAIGIYYALRDAEPDTSATTVNAVLRLWTSAQRYQRALASVGAVRVGLDGTPTEPVSPAHQTTAGARFKAMRWGAAQYARSPKVERDTTKTINPENASPSSAAAEGDH
jgi:sRNA-binding protein